MDSTCRRTIALLRTLPAALVAAVLGLADAAAQAPVAGTDHTLLEARLTLPAGGAVPPKFLDLFAPAARWQGALRWKYNHANAPAALAGDPAAVVAQLVKSFDKWSSQCGITHQYEGETTTPPGTVSVDPTYGPQPDGTSVVGWGTPPDPALGAWTYAWYAQDGGDRVLFDADTTLSPASIADLADLDRLMTHEWGHALGLGHSDTEAAIMAGPPSTHYNQLATPQPDDVRGCRCLYGLPAGVSSPYACSLPSQVDFGSATVGRASPASSVTLVNSGNAPLAIVTSTMTDRQFAHVAGCLPGTVVPPGQSCTLQLQVTPAAAGAQRGTFALFTNDGYYEMTLLANGVSGTSGGNERVTSAVPSVEMVEYYNATLDHYFVTRTPAEIAGLDAGSTPTRWTRTGRGFRMLPAAQPGTSGVCRYYIPPADGSSHFFGRDATECAAVREAHPDYVLEDPAYAHAWLPAAGTCPAGTLPLYRLFNNRPDANHRYTTDRALRDAMAGQGWSAEGDGPDAVALCVPAQ